MTAEMALRFGRAFSQSPQYWLNLQTAYDLKTTEFALRDAFQSVRELAAP